MSASSDLFQPARLGALHLRNRVVMAPLTRSRAGAGDAPGPLNAEYYRQRATAGLIVTEASQISPQGKGYAFTPGCYTPEQEAGWRLVTDAVHGAGGHVVLQLWHVGRISHPDLQPGHALPVAPSAIRPEGQAFTEEGFKPHPTPRALETGEMAGIVRDYAHAAEVAKRAGFDGVEIHAANGYLLDQFIRDSTNQRDDRYGGPAANRIRLTLEVAEAVCAVWGGDRVGIRLSPLTNQVGGIPLDSDPMGTYGLLVEELNRFELAYLHCVEGVTQGSRDEPEGFSFQRLRARFNGGYIANNGYTREMALRARHDDLADFICFGRPFIGNPDLVERLRRDAPLNTDNKSTWYGGGAEGYTDYPMLDAA
ncbi:alkene reductase [Roseomonas elaeocarpi]|uniref:Alkene reductase n=1 Tax=Roseomonas elaeocarpi TaxID=907779 RepID=A0ABV6JWP1_9PROT